MFVFFFFLFFFPLYSWPHTFISEIVPVFNSAFLFRSCLDFYIEIFFFLFFISNNFFVALFIMLLIPLGLSNGCHLQFLKFSLITYYNRYRYLTNQYFLYSQQVKWNSYMNEKMKHTNCLIFLDIQIKLHHIINVLDAIRSFDGALTNYGTGTCGWYLFCGQWSPSENQHIELRVWCANTSGSQTHFQTQFIQLWC